MISPMNIDYLKMIIHFDQMSQHNSRKSKQNLHNCLKEKNYYPVKVRGEAFYKIPKLIKYKSLIIIGIEGKFFGPKSSSTKNTTGNIIHQCDIVIASPFKIRNKTRLPLSPFRILFYTVVKTERQENEI